MISIIMPYFKNEKFVFKSINSVLKQTYKNFEFIIIYDDHDKNTYKKIQNFALKDKRIKLLKNKKNLGAGLSRNKAINISRGKFIAFIDSDDIWVKSKLYFQLNFMEKKKIFASHTSYKIIDEKGKFISNRVARNLNYNDLIKSCDIGLSTVMLNKKILKKKQLFPNLKTKEDYTLWLKIAKKNVIFYGIDKQYVYWRNTEDSLSKNIFQKLMDSIRVYHKYEKFSLINSLFKTIVLSINYLMKNK